MYVDHVLSNTIASQMSLLIDSWYGTVPHNTVLYTFVFFLSLDIIESLHQVTGRRGTNLLGMLGNGFFDSFLECFLDALFQFTVSFHGIRRHNGTIFITLTIGTDQFHGLTLE